MPLTRNRIVGRVQQVLPQRARPIVPSRPNSQGKSPFFIMIPLEIRLMIYRHAFPYCEKPVHVRMLHVASNQDRLVSNVCQAANTTELSHWERDRGPRFSPDVPCWGSSHEDCYGMIQDQIFRTRKGSLPNHLSTKYSILSIFLTCSRM
jgi:hypothetical protein